MVQSAEGDHVLSRWDDLVSLLGFVGVSEVETEVVDVSASMFPRELLILERVGSGELAGAPVEVVQEPLQVPRPRRHRGQPRQKPLRFHRTFGHHLKTTEWIAINWISLPTKNIKLRLNT